MAAYKSSSPDIASSRSRVDGFARELVEKYRVELVADIPSLCSKVDGVLIESGDGRAHLAQVKRLLAARKPMFIDKPLASTLQDVREIAYLAKEAGVPWFSSSSQRYALIATTMKFPDITGAIDLGSGACGRASLSGTGVVLDPSDRDSLHADGARLQRSFAVYKRERGKRLRRHCRPLERWTHRYRAYASPEWQLWSSGLPAEGTVQSPGKQPLAYAALVKQFVNFFQTGKPPVSNEETLEIYAFMDAGQRSKENRGKSTALR